MSRRDHDLQAFTTIFPSGIHGALTNVPPWVQCAIGRRIREGNVTIVSAVCPDYERENGILTYRNLGEGTPLIAEQHLDILQNIAACFTEHHVKFRCVMTLADTEFDLPLVLKYMTNGSSEEFLRRCQASCDAILHTAQKRGIPIEQCVRFTAVFDGWFANYHRALAMIREQATSSPSVRQNFLTNSCDRVPLYRAMTGTSVSNEYCQEMVLRQWAQYAAWGECASNIFGKSFVMINHSTPNLTRVNEPFFRNGRERIPILQLRATTMPG